MVVFHEMKAPQMNRVTFTMMYCHCTCPCTHVYMYISTCTCGMYIIIHVHDCALAFVCPVGMSVEVGIIFLPCIHFRIPEIRTPH